MDIQCQYLNVVEKKFTNPLSALAYTHNFIGLHLLSASSHPLVTQSRWYAAFGTDMTESEPHSEEYEAQHVHSVYEEIASHFSSTRYKVCVTIPHYM